MKVFIILMLSSLLSNFAVANEFLDDLHVQASLDTFSYKSLEDELEVDWSLEVGSAKQYKYEYLLSYSHTYDKQVDTFSRDTIRETKIEISQQYDLNRIFGKFGLTTHISLSKIKENDIYTQKYNIEAAPLGIKYDIYESEKITDFSFSYLPTYNYLEHYDQDFDFDGNALLEKFIERSLLHVFRFEFSFEYKSFTFSEEANWKEIKPFDETIKDQRDFIFHNEFVISYKLNDYFSISYKNDIEVDSRRKEVQDQPSTDHEHSISFRVHWN